MFFGNCLIDQTQAIHSQPLTEMHHHGWIEWLFVFIGIITEQVLQVRILPDQLYCLFVGYMKFFFYKQRTQSKPHCLGCPADTLGEALLVLLFNFFPGNYRCKLHPSVVTFQVSTEWQIELLEIRCFILFLVHGIPSQVHGF